MAWNWQLANWPEFTWDPLRLVEVEHAFAQASGVFVGMVKHLADADRDRLAVESMSMEAMSSSEIEGQILDRDSVQASICRQLGLAHDRRSVAAAEQGISEMTVDLYRNYQRPLAAETLFGWHRMVTNGRTDLQDVGRWRTGAEPMQIVSGRYGASQVHFEAPPAARVPEEMARFVEWFKRTAPGGATALPPLTKAGLAHVYFESIHPFEDGNGRIGRAIAEMALAQRLHRPTLTSLAETMLRRKREYYDRLGEMNRSTDATEWLVWFAGAAIEGQQRTLAKVEFLIWKTRFLDKLRGKLNARQEMALLRMLREGAEGPLLSPGFAGGLRAEDYRRITKASTATTSRDLADLVEKGALRRTGEKKGVRYWVAGSGAGVSWWKG